MLHALCYKLHDKDMSYMLHATCYIKKHRKTIALVFACLALAFFVGDSVSAQATLSEGDVTTTGDVIARMIAGLGSVLVALLGWLVSAMIGLIVSVAQYNNFTTAAAVNLAWPVLRDFANLFFIIVLLITAIGTILGVESYQYKEKLPEIIIMAVFINFSKTITGLLIDVSQVVMLTFVAAFKDIAAGNLITGSKAMDFLTYHGSGGEGLGIGEALLGAAVTVLLAVFLLIIFFFVLLAVLLVLLWRILMLWILAVLSPLPYLMMVFPGGEHYAKEWWETFTKYLFSGPTLAFFLWLTVSLVSVTNGELGAELGVQHDPTPAAGVPNAVISKIGDSAELLGFLIIISLLLIGLEVASKSGVMGGEFAGKVMGGLEHNWAGGKFGFETIARKWNEKGWINPAAIWKGYVERREELQKSAHEKGAALGRQRFETFITRGALKLPRLDVVERGEEEEFAKRFAAMQRMQKAFAAADIMDLGGEEGKRARRGMLVAAAKEGHLDDIMSGVEIQKAMRKDKTFLDHFRGGTLNASGEIEGGKLVHNFESLKAFTKWYMKDDHEAPRVAYDIGEIGRGHTHKEYLGLAEVDEETGGYEFTTNNSESLGESGKIEPQRMVSDAPHEYIDFDPATGEVYEMSETEFRRSTQAFSAVQDRDIPRLQPRLATRAMGGSSISGGINKESGYAMGIERETDPTDKDYGKPRKDNDGLEKVGNGLKFWDIQRLAQFYTIDGTPEKKLLQAFYKRSGGTADDIRIQLAPETVKALGLDTKTINGVTVEKDATGKVLNAKVDGIKAFYNAFIANDDALEILNQAKTKGVEGAKDLDPAARIKHVPKAPLTPGEKPPEKPKTPPPPPVPGVAPAGGPTPGGDPAAGGGAGGGPAPGGPAAPPPYVGPSADDIGKAVAEAMRTVMAEQQGARPPKADTGGQEFAPLLRKLSAAMGEQQKVLEATMREVASEKAGVQAGGPLGSYNRRMLQALQLISGRLSSLNRAGTLPADMDDVLDKVNDTLSEVQTPGMSEANVRVRLEKTLDEI